MNPGWPHLYPQFGPNWLETVPYPYFYTLKYILNLCPQLSRIEFSLLFFGTFDISDSFVQFVPLCGTGGMEHNIKLSNIANHQLFTAKFWSAAKSRGWKPETFPFRLSYFQTYAQFSFLKLSFATVTKVQPVFRL